MNEEKIFEKCWQLLKSGKFKKNVKMKVYLATGSIYTKSSDNSRALRANSKSVIHTLI